MNDFELFLQELGLRPRAVVADGRVRRCPTESHPRKKNGAYMLAPDGQFGWGRDWAVHADPVLWRPETPVSIPLPDPRKIRAAQRDDRAKRLAAVKAARAFYEASAPLVGGHPYLEAHGLDMTGCRGLKVDAEGWLVVPMLREGSLVSVQRISPDGAKLFWKDAPTRGASYRIEHEWTPLTVLCEGLATGLALYAALPNARVVVAFNAGNLPRVAAQLPRRGMAAVAADNDHGTEERRGINPGLASAEEAAAVLGCGVALPEGIEGTDWADWRMERQAAVRARPLYGSRAPLEANVRRTVDAELARAVMAAARFLPAKRIACALEVGG